MDKIDLEILYNKAECKVIDQKWKDYWEQREIQNQETSQNKKKIVDQKIIVVHIVLIIVGVILTLIFPEIWNILISFGIVISLVGFLPFTLWLLFFSKTETIFDFWYHR